MPRPTPSAAPRLVRLFVREGAVGFVVAGMFVAGLMGLDLGGFGSLVRGQQAWGALALLWFVLGLTFASAQIAMTVMGLGARGGPQP